MRWTPSSLSLRVGLFLSAVMVSISVLISLSYCSDSVLPELAKEPKEPRYTNLLNEAPLPPLGLHTPSNGQLPWEDRVDGVNHLLFRNMDQFIPQDRRVEQASRKYDSAIVCACAKCGTTSTYQYLYKRIFGHPWEYNDAPWIQTLSSERWRGIWDERSIGDRELVRYIHDDPKAFSFALIRDPIERLISAWKSKFACKATAWGTDLGDRKTMTRHLLKLASLPLPNRNETICLSFSDYLKALALVHISGKVLELNVHMLPQHLGCFRHTDPSRWSYITVASDPHLKDTLDEAMGIVSDSGSWFEHSHRSSTATLSVTDEDQKILEFLTATERQVLSPYLPSMKSL